MAKDMENQDLFKKVSFGGYDKDQVDMYIAQLKQEHMADIAGLKETIAKLSDTVRNLQQMRESNTSESKQTVDTLKKYTESLKQEIAEARAEADQYKAKAEGLEAQSDSISRILIDSRNRADDMIAQAQADNDALTRRTEEECANLRAQTESDCSAQRKKTQEECDLKYAQAEQDRKNTKEFTENECRRMFDKAKEERETMLAKAKRDAEEIRDNMLRECSTINMHVNNLLSAMNGIMGTCNEAKDISDAAFKSLLEAPEIKLPENDLQISQVVPPLGEAAAAEEPEEDMTEVVEFEDYADSVEISDSY